MLFIGGTMDKDTIKTEVARRLERKVDDITDAEIKASLLFVSLKLPELSGECTTNLIIGQAGYDLRSLPNKFKRLVSARLDDGQRDDTLYKINSFDEYQSLMAGEEVADYDEPEAYIIFNDILYLYPTPNQEYTLRLFIEGFELNPDSIGLPDEYEELITSYACYAVLKNKGLARTDEAQGHLQDALTLIASFKEIGMSKIPAISVQYNDF